MKELNLLLEACKMAISEEKETTTLVEKIEEIDWEKLNQLASTHRVRPLLRIGLKKLEHLVHPPVTFMKRLEAITFQIVTKNLNQTKELIRLFELFKNHNISVIAYKGIMLAEGAYQDLGAREFSDIDLLIDLKDFKKVKQILLEQNYQWISVIPDNMERQYFSMRDEHGFHYYVEGKRQYAIDLHWVIGAKHHQLAIDFEMIRPMINLNTVYQSNIPVLSLEVLFLTTCLHHFGKDQSHSLRNVCDIAAIIGRKGIEINWNLVMKTAQEWKVKNILLLGIGVNHKLFSIKLPPTIQVLLKSKKLNYHIDNHIRLLKSNKHSFNGSIKTTTNILVLHLQLREYLSTKLKIICYFLLLLIHPNSKDIEKSNSPNPNYWLMLIKKPFRLGKKNISFNKNE